MKSAAVTATAQDALASGGGALAPSRSLSIGYLAMLPLLAAYEVALLTRPGSARNTAQLVLDLALRPLGEHATQGRWVVLALAALIACAIALRRGAHILGGVARVMLEGLLAACVLGPLMVVVLRSLEGYLPVIDSAWDPGQSVPGLVDSALVFGAGAWEELLFRVGIYSFLYWLALRAAAAFDAGERVARALADVVGLSLSSLTFAAAHFAPVLKLLGPGGRPFDAALFVWLTLGGLLLGLLFRLRGPGVAAWTHGLFNVALWIGIDPDVIW